MPRGAARSRCPAARASNSLLLGPPAAEGRRHRPELREPMVALAVFGRRHQYSTAEHFMRARRRACSATPTSRRACSRRRRRSRRRRSDARCAPSTARPGTPRRVDAVVRGNLAKFAQNPRLWRYLDATGEAVLVEASPVDSIWGIGLPPGRSASAPARGVGGIEPARLRAHGGARPAARRLNLRTALRTGLRCGACPPTRPLRGSRR